MFNEKNLLLCGKHSNRTPAAYKIYKEALKSEGINVFTLNDIGEEVPDFIVTGFHIDIPEIRPFYEKYLAINKSLQVFVISEEPLWDLTWHSSPLKRKHTCKVTGIDYEYINHFNSGLFDGLKIPYFITTETKYLARYITLLTNHCKLNPEELMKIWNSADYTLSCFVERREDAKYLKVSECGTFKTYSNFRSSLVSPLLEVDKVQVQGKGWHDDAPRQMLPDWHADKLARCMKRSKFVMAIENVNAPSYMTEKYFDALVSLAIPLTAECQNSTFSEYLSEPSSFSVSFGSHVNLLEKLDSFTVKREFAQEYLVMLTEVKKLLANQRNVNESIRMVTSRLKNYFIRGI